MKFGNRRVAAVPAALLALRLGAARAADPLGFNSVRAIVHDPVWEQDSWVVVLFDSVLVFGNFANCVYFDFMVV